MDNELEALERTELGSSGAGVGAYRIGCVQSSVLFSISCCFPAENASVGEEGPVGGQFEDEPGKAPKPSEGLPVSCRRRGLSCNRGESPREKTNCPSQRKSIPLPPGQGPWLCFSLVGWAKQCPLA